MTSANRDREKTTLCNVVAKSFWKAGLRRKNSQAQPQLVRCVEKS